MAGQPQRQDHQTGPQQLPQGTQVNPEYWNGVTHLAVYEHQCHKKTDMILIGGNGGHEASLQSATQ